MSEEQDAHDARDALEILSRIGDILIVLSDVASGDFHTRCPKDIPETHPLGALFTGINEMIDALEAEGKRSQAYQRELEEKLATIEQQRQAITELSAPIIEVWSGVLCLVIVGAMDQSRSLLATEALLNAVASKRARYTIVDITGIAVMDTAATDHFIRIARTVRLLGAHCMLTGLSPAIAQTIVGIGADMSGISVHQTLRDALQQLVKQELARATSLHRSVL